MLVRTTGLLLTIVAVLVAVLGAHVVLLVNGHRGEINQKVEALSRGLTGACMPEHTLRFSIPDMSPALSIALSSILGAFLMHVYDNLQSLPYVPVQSQA